MTQYYLRIEGVNLSSVLEDTQQLSVIRGSGLLLRDAIRIIHKTFLFLEPISTGASTGLFKFEVENSNDAEKTKLDIAERLNSHWRLKYFTFVVDIYPVENNFIIEREAIIAKNRFRQMQQVSVVMPDKNDSIGMDLPCEANNLYPASKTISIATKPSLVCLSVYERLQYGRDQKRQFYRNETKLKLQFTQDLKELADDEHNGIMRGNCHNKIAVLYFDGNQFSKIQNKYCQSVETQRDFDLKIQDKRKIFLGYLLDFMSKDDAYKTQDGKLRLETLLWGGDEMIFVVPAWKGLEVLNLFYEQTKDWTFSVEKNEPIPLTHAGGIVFCHANTPIQRVEKLAKELAELVKNSTGGRDSNLFEYAILESIDFPTESIDTFRKKQFGSVMTQSRQPLKPFGINELNALLWLKKNLPKGQVYACARAAVGEMNKTSTSLTETFQRLVTVVRLQEQENNTDAETQALIVKKLELAFQLAVCPPEENDLYWHWVHLVELWDYLPEEISI